MFVCLDYVYDCDVPYYNYSVQRTVKLINLSILYFSSSEFGTFSSVKNKFLNQIIKICLIFSL